MNGTTSFGPKSMSQDREPHGTLRADEAAWGSSSRGIVRVMAAADRRSWSLLCGHFSARATPIAKSAVEAAGAVDAENASTAPWKTAKNAVSHSYHKPSPFPSVTQSVTHVPG
jgi:hypothetical protein